MEVVYPDWVVANVTNVAKNVTQECDICHIVACDTDAGRVNRLARRVASRADVVWVNLLRRASHGGCGAGGPRQRRTRGDAAVREIVRDGLGIEVPKVDGSEVVVK